MTAIARSVLVDCEAAWAELPDPPTNVWRLRWVALLALLRAVGYVLDNRDGARSPEMRAAVDAKWAELKLRSRDDKIFWEFIDAERQGILHAYEFTASQSVTVFPQVGGLVANASGSRVLAAPRAVYTSTMALGPFQGQAPKDVAAAALKWWHAYLDDVDRRAAHTG